MINIIKRLFQIKREKVYYMTKNDLLEVKAKVDCNVLLIDGDNYDRVLDMREEIISRVFYDMLNDGQIGVLGEVDKTIVSHAWIQIAGSSKKNYNGGFGKLNNNEAIIHFCNTDPKYRGNNIYPFLVYKLAEIYFKQNPNGTLYITTSVDNHSSQKGLSKIGFKYLEDRLIFKICKFIKFTISMK